MVTSASGPIVQRSSALTQFILAPNPGPMSLEGTNSYIVGADGDCAVVIDPGPLHEGHLQELAATARVALILITHRHSDHTAGASRLHQITGAPVRAADPVHCHGGPVLTDNEIIRTCGVDLRVLATPGHTSDSLSFYLPDDGPAGAVLTGDTVLGRGTTVLDFPDGSLADYLASLDRLERLGPATVLPAHGPVLPALDNVVGAYRSHRLERLEQIRRALNVLGAGAGVHEVTDLVYSDVEPDVRKAAENSVAAQLAYLRGKFPG